MHSTDVESPPPPAYTPHVCMSILRTSVWASTPKVSHAPISVRMLVVNDPAVRPTVADLREKHYEDTGHDCYLLKADENTVIDTTIKVRTKQLLSATSSTRVLNRRVLSYLASYDMATNICQAHSPPRHRPLTPVSDPRFLN